MFGRRAAAQCANGLYSVTGIDLKHVYCNVAYMPRYMRDLWTYRRHPAAPRLRHGRLWPILRDYRDTAGVACGHYFWQDLWAARKIHAAAPEHHLDIGSRVDGFIAHLLSFRQVTLIDVRPLPHPVEGLAFVQDDATQLAGFANQSVASISSLHAVEHFGLGRYNDPIDPDACFKAMTALQRVLKCEGRLYFSVPIGRERVEFNAHRVFAPQTILKAFRELQLVDFSAVDSIGAYQPHAQPQDFADAHYACGLFEFTRARSNT